MKPYQKEFIEFILEAQVLQFGQFELKSGRSSPYFFHIAKLFSGTKLVRLGYFYEAALVDAGLKPKALFGPAYKGIPLVIALAQTLASSRTKGQQRDLPCLFSRKENKDHGEGGQLIGDLPLNQPCLIVDDVLTAGTAVRETLALMQAADIRASGLLVALDRQERADPMATQTACSLLEKEGLPVAAIITLVDLIEYLRSHRRQSVECRELEAYYNSIGDTQ